MFSARTKKFLLFMMFAVIAALIIRLAVAHDLYSFNNGRNAVQYPPPTTDMATYMELSQKILNGNYHGEFNYQPFYYVVALPIVRFISGGSLWGVICFQALLGALTCLLAGLCTAHFCGRRGAYCAAGLTLFCGIVICYTPFHLIATIQAFWLILLLYMVIIAMKRNSLCYWSIVGLLTGCAILTRGNIWFFVPGIALGALFSAWKRACNNQSCNANIHHDRQDNPGAEIKTGQVNSFTAILAHPRQLLKTILPALLLMGFIVLPQIPFAWHNSVVKGHLSGPSTAADQVLALGNTKESPPGGRNPEFLAGPMEYPPSYGMWMKKRDTVSVPQRIINWFTEQPLAYVELSFRKLLLFWDAREIPNNISFIQARKQSPWLRKLGFIPSGLILAGAIAGMLLWLPRIRHNNELMMLYYFIIAYWGGTAAFYILARFRMPLLPLLTIPAAMGIEWLIRHRKDGRKLLISGAAAYIAGYFVCYQAYDIYRQNLEPSFIRFARPDGIKVKMAANRYMLLDNGPMTFGGWGPFPLTAGIPVVKTFTRLPEGQMSEINLELPLIAENEGSAVIAINGKNEYVTFTHPGMQKFTFKLTPAVNNKVVVKLVGGTTAVSVIMDYQRDYARTAVDGKTVPAELVCRLFCQLKP